jgi:hypothetical protein
MATLQPNTHPLAVSRPAPGIMLVELDPADVSEMRRVWLLGELGAGTRKCPSGNFETHNSLVLRGGRIEVVIRTVLPFVEPALSS